MPVLNDCMQCLGPALRLKVCWRAFGDPISVLYSIFFLLESFPGTQPHLLFYQPNLSIPFLSLFNKEDISSFVLYIIPIYFELSSLNVYTSLESKVVDSLKFYLIFHAFPTFALLDLASSTVVFMILVSKTMSMQ